MSKTKKKGLEQTIMTLTRTFKATVTARADRDHAFRSALLQEAVQTLLNGDEAGGRSILREYISATLGFEALSDITHMPARTLKRMFGTKGSPKADNLFEVISILQKHTEVNLEVSTISEPT